MTSLDRKDAAALLILRLGLAWFIALCFGGFGFVSLGQLWVVVDHAFFHGYPPLGRFL